MKTGLIAYRQVLRKAGFNYSKCCSSPMCENWLFLHVKVTNYMRYIFINICSLLNTYEQGTHN